MGSYTNNLARRLRPARGAFNGERLTNAAIRREGVVHANGRSHYEVRYSLGDPSPSTSNPYDEEGFLTSAGRFVTRIEAVQVGVAAGQCRPQVRELLSSDISW